MATGIEDYEQLYQQAYLAYVDTNYEQAASIIDQVVPHLPDDPNIRLLRGHIYYVLQQYDVAKAEYQYVLELTSDPNITSYAHSGLEAIEQYQRAFDQQDNVSEKDEKNQSSFSSQSKPQVIEEEIEDAEELEEIKDIDSNSFDLKSFDIGRVEEAENEMEELPVSSPFDIPLNESVRYSSSSSSQDSMESNPFAVKPDSWEQKDGNTKEEELALPPFLEDDLSDFKFSDVEDNNPQPFSTTSVETFSDQLDSSDSPFAQMELPSLGGLGNENFFSNSNSEEDKDINLRINIADDETLLTNDIDLIDDSEVSYNSQEKFSNSQNNTLESIAPSFSSESDGTVRSKSEPTSQDKSFRSNSKSIPLPQVDSSSSFSNFAYSNLGKEEKQNNSNSKTQQNTFDDDDSFDFEAFESAFGSEAFSEDEESSSRPVGGNTSKGSNIEFLDDFDDFDDLGNIPGFDITDSNVPLRSASIEKNGRSRNPILDTGSHDRNVTSDRDAELFSITGSQEGVPVFTQGDVSKVEAHVSVEQGVLAPLENAPLQTKQWITAGTVGCVSALVVAAVSFTAANFTPKTQREAVRNTGWAMSLAAGLAGFASASFMGSLAFKQIRRTTKDLQTQFDAVSKGNLNVQATVYSEDELGQLAASFNEMARVIFTTTHEATRKAQEQEEAKENLQRQVIRLLDDVEGAARGDLTVQAEVTADVLGAVADAFNLTIQNLRDIVQQVKVAAREVTRGATNSETFARALSSDALRQAEELAVTLNSVQVMTDSIHRVAEAAREAEAVARDASQIALKGGDAVENTVAGILEIRETVAETTRKVKRLAESSQEISKIVALISQIASRTNLLALNASIEAARAGEAGRGFAIVADEVRQLADRSAKSLKEIEEIVRQIQSETGSVMTAMEEGTQQVIKGTQLAEEAKRSLENIIQVAKRIDSLVRGITADTVEQTETSRAVAQVMQSVELTAQETSQEAQRVSGALQHLVGVSRDLIASVERFRVETSENTR
ncbi:MULTISPECIES: methyl-accepting chemotaxis protein [Nostocales]|uniref:Chemotaxis protein n=2 Tax=Nostocales TaxID=1161 RepID=A0A0C1R4F1_9CYAN|nr:methyl-accepting chemotaxis protein [Tolypothrix bouteillei]KAF3886628.1 HAMP domain-containing protein [Tolypothrix bouteillei VB521301]